MAVNHGGRGGGYIRWERVREWLLPARCLLCLGRCGPELLCAACLAELPWRDGACPRCAAPGARAGCRACAEAPPPWSRGWCACSYREPLRGLVLALKFGGRLPAATALGAVLARTPPAERPELVVPVPLHPRRLAERGFNQAALIAGAACRIWGLPLAMDALRRTRATPAQSRSHSVGERQRNLSGAFTACAGQVGGRHVLVVDDILTTGSTLGAVARALAAAGAARVDVAACCHTEPGEGPRGGAVRRPGSPPAGRWSR